VLDLQTIARATGGEVCGTCVKCPAPGHSDRDRSLSIRLAPDQVDGFVVYNHSDGNHMAGKRWVLDQLGIKSQFNGAKAKTAEPTDIFYIYENENGAPYLRVKRTPDKQFYQYHMEADRWVKGHPKGPKILFHLPQLLAAEHGNVVFVEGEKDVLTMERLGFVATTNPMGAGKWWPELNQYFSGRDVVIMGDNDRPGIKHAVLVESRLRGVARSVRVVKVPEKFKDVSDWVDIGGATADDIGKLIDGVAIEVPEFKSEAKTEPANEPGISVDDFYAFMPTHSYIFTPTREMWHASSVNARIAPIPCGEKVIPASRWLDQNRPVEQLSWMPGLPMVISGKLIAEGGWIERPGVSCFNLYRPPVIRVGNAANAGAWLDHARKIYGEDADHIVHWLAHRVQRPGEKINHALMLGGAQGIGKDTLLEPVKHAVGPWNFIETSPQQVLGRFNGFTKSVILRISEARDLGDSDRFGFYDHLKVYAAAPPDVLRVDEKNLREYSVPNVTGIIITSYHKSDGIYLPADDRRHYVAWSDLTKEQFNESYWRELWRWYHKGGIADVAAYLAALDLGSFDPKAPPPKTAAFWQIVDANRAPEDAELADALDLMGWPDATTVEKIAFRAHAETTVWLRDRKNRRIIPHRLDRCGYVATRNPDAPTDGLWRIGGKRQAVYAKTTLPLRDQIAAARRLAE
jgi:hypothetical protein